MTSGRSKPIIVGGSGGQQRKQTKGAASNQSTQALPAFPRAAGRGARPPCYRNTISFPKTAVHTGGASGPMFSHIRG